MPGVLSRIKRRRGPEAQQARPTTSPTVRDRLAQRVPGAPSTAHPAQSGRWRSGARCHPNQARTQGPMILGTDSQLPPATAGDAGTPRVFIWSAHAMQRPPAPFETQKGSRHAERQHAGHVIDLDLARQERRQMQGRNNDGVLDPAHSRGATRLACEARAFAPRTPRSLTRLVTRWSQGSKKAARMGRVSETG